MDWPERAKHGLNGPSTHTYTQIHRFTEFALSGHHTEFALIHTYTHTHIHTYTHTHIHTYTHTHIHTDHTEFALGKAVRRQ